ncbi:MAG TPA: hypothetical protein VMV41_16075 [Cellulomonadaceae bacterium]|nr:hypothetical protein [Cellulomonadaceae bacterium]
MAHTTGFSHHAAGAVYGDAPVDLPIEPLVRETPDEFRARMDAKRETAAAARLTPTAASAKAGPLPVGPVPTPRPRPARVAAPAAKPRVSSDAAIVTAYVAGDSVPQIAASTGHTRRTVLKVLTASGVHLRDDRATRSGNAAKGLSAEIAAAGLTSATLRAWAAEHGIPVTHKGIPGRSVLAAYLDDPARNVLAEHPECEFVPAPEVSVTWFMEPERQHVDVPDIMAANPSIGLTAHEATIAARIVAESVPLSPPATTPDDPEPEPDVPPIVTALAAVSRLAVELADLRPRLSARDRRAVDATLVALGTPEPSLLKSLFGAP